ncbi:MAG: hypothetical protein V4530_17970 [Pseudomonadota bacterium]
MVYLVASIVSFLLLAGSLGLIFSTVRTSHARIIGALLGQPMDYRMVAVRDARPRRHRVTIAARQPVMSLRAAA